MEKAIIETFGTLPYKNEEALQIVIINFLEKFYPNIRFCASLGGIRTGIKQGRKAKKTGYRAGFPDLQICEARGGYFGLFLELKPNKKRYATPLQKLWIEDLNKRGYLAAVTKGLPETLEILTDYLNQPKTQHHEKTTEQKEKK